MNLTKHFSALLIATGSMITPIASASEAEELHRKHCQHCHDDSIYTRANPLVLTYSALGERVRFCENMAGANLNEKQIQSVIDYLNDKFYKYERR